MKGWAIPRRGTWRLTFFFSCEVPGRTRQAAKSFRVRRAVARHPVDAALLAFLDPDLAVRAGALDLHHVRGEFPPSRLGVGAIVENGVGTDGDNNNKKNEPNHERSPMS